MLDLSKTKFLNLLIFLILLPLLEVQAQKYNRDTPAYGFKEQIMIYMDSLDFYVAQKDTSNVVFVASNLITRFHRAQMEDRAPYYIELVLQYADKENRPGEYARFCNHMGMFLASSAYKKGLIVGDTIKYYQLIDSARWWHQQSIKLVEKSNSEHKISGGYGFRGLLQINFMTFNTKMNRFDSIDYYYEQCIRIAKETDTEELTKAASQMYGRYLLARKRLPEFIPILNRIGKDLPSNNVSDNFAYYRTLHDYIAMRNQLDTLIHLSDKLILEYQKLVAAKHSEGIYEADQKFEVSQTKKSLQATIKELNNLSTNFFLLVGVVLILLVAVAFIFLQYKKNRRLVIHNEALLKEQNHRVKNNLQMIASLLSLQSKKVVDADAKRFLKDNEARVRSISILNRLLYQQEDISLIDLKTYFSSLSEELKHSAGQEVEFNINIPENIRINVEKSTSIGLVLNELITNSFKHGGSAMTEIGIVVEKSNESSLKMTYYDNGVGCEANSWESSKSFGHQLVKIQLKQIYADYHILNENGFTFQINIPFRL